jgi:hypothetical protein
MADKGDIHEGTGEVQIHSILLGRYKYIFRNKVKFTFVIDLQAAYRAMKFNLLQCVSFLTKESRVHLLI